MIYNNHIENFGLVMNTKISVEDGIKLAVTHPERGEMLLAKTIVKTLQKENWLNDQYKLKFCIMFVDNLIDGAIEKSLDQKVLKKISQLSFVDGLKILRKRPNEGMKYMLAIIMKELRTKQQYSTKEQFAFYDTLLRSFFPSHKVSDFIKE